MLSKNGNRELVYVSIVDEIKPIPGYDRVEYARVNGWWCIVQKDQFKVGDPAIYFEIDSRVPSDRECFAFLEKRNYKIKTLRMCKVISQGLLMHPRDFGWTIKEDNDGTPVIETYISGKDYKLHRPDDESRFLTSLLGVTYADDADNKRKANSGDKYKAMAARRPNIFRKKWARWMMRREWGRKIMYFFFGQKKKKGNSWPSHICQKTDVERVQNMMWVFKSHKLYVASEKVDGSSMTVACEPKKFGLGYNYYVCSRNVVFKDENQKCFYDDNIYFEMYKKYNLRDIITRILVDYKLPNVALQMEVYGDKVQKRDYSIKEHRIAVFHIVSGGRKLNMDMAMEICEKYGLPHVPIVDDNYELPDTIEELQEFVEGAPSALDGKMREGIVFYDKETGQEYFKFVSPNYLLKYHQ